MSFAELNGAPCRQVDLTAPWVGVWVATVVLEDDKVPSGAVTLQLGSSTFRGTVDPGRSGSFAGGGTVVIRGGAGAWSKLVAARKYHNDGQLQRRSLAVDAAREVGETLTVGAEAELNEPLGVDFARESAPASRILEQLYPRATWWVGADGVTRLGRRATRDVTNAVQILNYDPRIRYARLALEDDVVANVMPGGSILDTVRAGSEPFVIRELDLVVRAESIRAFGWGSTSRTGPIAGGLHALEREADPTRTFLGLYRYRVYRMAGDRIELQIVKPRTGLPDVLPIPMGPSLAGTSAELQQGALVLVQFVEGDPSLPVMTHATSKGDAAFLPLNVSIDATLAVNLGEAHAPVLRSGDAVKVSLTGAIVSGGSGTITDALGTIELNPAVVNIGPPPAGKSKVNA